MNATSTPSAVAGPGSLSTGESDASGRVPLFVLFAGAAFWLLVASIFSLVASLKFHSPGFLADCAWLTYGRVRPVANDALLYGFALPAGLGVGLWILAQEGRTRIFQPWIVAVGAKLWNLGVAVGLIGILAGDSTGFENLELPRYAAVILFIGYLLIGFCSLATLHSRGERRLEAPQWFLLAGLFWFPWIFSTAHLLLTFYPVRGVTQAVVSWWFSANLNFVWLGLMGLAAAFYFVPRLVRRPLHSQYLALFTFWTLILFASWGGIPGSAPLPAWLPTLSAIATVLSLVTVLSVMVNVHRTVGHGCSGTENPPSGKFFAFGLMAFVVAWLMQIVSVVPPVASVTQFTWFTVAQSQLNLYGFFAMTMLGAIYYIVPRVTGLEWPCVGSVRVHYWLAALGTVLCVVPLAIGGVLQGIKLNGAVPFNDISKLSLHFLRLSTLGELLILAGHLLLLANLARLSVRFIRIHFVPLVAAATVELKPAEVKS